MRPFRFAIPALAALAATLAAALPAGSAVAGPAIEVVHPWARPTIPNRPGAVYAGLHNRADRADRLVGARSPRAGQVELHEAEEKDGVMTMRRVETVEVPAGGMAHLGPGGLHLMLFDIDPPLENGETIEVTLEFEHAGEIAVSVPVSRDAPAQGHGDDHREGHGEDHGEGHGAAD